MVCAAGSASVVLWLLVGCVLVGCSAEERSQVCDTSADKARRDEVLGAMRHAWNGYQSFAWGYDELMPHSRMGSDRWGGYGVTLVDSLDTLWVMGMHSEFDKAEEWVRTSLDFSRSNTSVDLGLVSVFEIIIRSLGGLLSAYSLSQRQIFLDKAIELGDRLLPAFQTRFGLPFTKIRLADGKGIIPESRLSSEFPQSVPLSEVGTMQLEMKMLSHASGNPAYAAAADRAMEEILSRGAVYEGLYPLFLDADSREPVTSSTGVGAFSDSFYEYLLKLWLWSGKKDHRMRALYDRAVDGIHAKLIQRSQPSGLAYMTDSNGTHPASTMHHLMCFVPGMLALGASTAVPGSPGAAKSARDLASAAELMATCRALYSSQPTGLAPDQVDFSHSNRAGGAPQDRGARFNALMREFKAGGMSVAEAAAASVDRMQQAVSQDFVVGQGPAERAYFLRPEISESLYIMYSVTGNSTYKQWAWELFEAIQKHCKAGVGYGTYPNVQEQGLPGEDSMESFFLAETLKYHYLIFSEHSVSMDEYVFNTEAHPFRIPGA